MKNKLVRGIGIYEKGLYPTKSKEYQLWDSMLHRCEKYVGCTIDPAFIRFQDFATWCQHQIGFKSDRFELDKDILSMGNKTYGPETCVFVPQQINVMLTHNQRNRGLYPTGVCLYKPTGKYKAAIKIDGVTTHIGYYDTPESAQAAYQTTKLIEIRRQAQNYADRIDPRAYNALMNWR